MNRIEMVKRLINEGLSKQTLVNFTDKQLKSLCERMVSESVTMVPKEDQKTQEKLKGERKSFEIYEKKKPTEKQLSTLDKNKNGEIDKEDFKMLRSKKSSKEEVKEGGEKWIQKAIDPSKKGSLKKALGVKKDEKIPETKLKAASKKGGKLGQRARLAMTLKKLKENHEISEWVNNLAETNYHPFTSKGEIMELLQRKLNETETMTPMPKKAKIGHNGIPEFMTYDSIMGSTKEKETPTETPVREKPTPTERPKPKTPYEPGPGTDTKPKAGIKKIQERKK
jgi:hypothetical protein